MHAHRETPQLSPARALLRSAALALLLLTAAPTAHARREASFNYPYARVWTTAVRLMRIDFECSIDEKDKDDGYFLFQYPDHGKQFPGSVEFVATKQDDVETVRVVIQIPAMPSYVEAMMMDRLAHKLEQEFGAPKERKPPPATDPATDKDDPEHPGDSDKGRADAPAPKPKPGPDRAQPFPGE